MYVPDIELLDMLDDLSIEVEDAAAPFVPENQIQPCSIDLRLSSTFWRARSVSALPLDLGSPNLEKVHPHRHWKRQYLSPQDSLILKPGELILGRTFEKFSIPKGFAGKIEGRSSFARLGLSVHCTGDFINPGYRGHMPLQLINHTRHPIRLVPRIHICQLVIVKLKKQSKALYNDGAPARKYYDDDGGPSLWWKDPTAFAAFSKINQQLNLPERTLDTLRSVVGDRANSISERLHSHLNNSTSGAACNPIDVLEEFSRKEECLKKWHNFSQNIWKWLGSTGVALSLGSLFSLPPKPLHIGLWAATFAFCILWLVEFLCWSSKRPEDFFVSKDFEEIERSHQKSSDG